MVVVAIGLIGLILHSTGVNKTLLNVHSNSAKFLGLIWFNDAGLMTRFNDTHQIRKFE